MVRSTRRALLAVVLILGGVVQAEAAPTFFLGAGTNVLNDVPWQNAVGSFVENDLNSYGHGSVLTSLLMGNVTVSIDLPNIPASGAEIFWGDYPPGGGVYGTVSGGALLNRRNGTVDGEVTFSFSTPVRGFGTWVFDNSTGSADSFEMIANGHTSGVLDANPGSTAHIVEGFLGVVDAAGISSVTVRNRSGQIGFELDHIQVSPIPEPGSLVPLGLVLTGWAMSHRRRRAA
jgi:hypothetical protein